MKTIIKMLSLSAMILIQACNSDNQTIVKTKMKTMLIEANGEISIQPNEASITIYLECVNKDIKVSKECLIKKSDELNQRILFYNIAKEDILTTAINQSKKYKWQNNSDVFEGFQASMTTLVTIKNLKILEALYADLLLNENIRIGGLTYSHSNMDSINILAYQKAIENANNIADGILIKMNKKEKEILRIGNISLPANQYQDNYISANENLVVSEKANVGKAKISINNGTMYASKTIYIEYKIK